jgi:hypothetical protein
MTERKYTSMTERDVTRMAKILVAAAGGEIRIPLDWLQRNRYVDLTLDEDDSVPGVRIYRTKWLRDAPGVTIEDSKVARDYAAGREIMDRDRIRSLPHAKVPASQTIIDQPKDDE